MHAMVPVAVSQTSTCAGRAGRTMGYYPAVFLLLSTVVSCSSELIRRADNEGNAGATRAINPFNLETDGLNVCTKTSLQLVTTYLTPDDLVSGCDSVYQPATCNALRSNDISVSDLYLRVVEYVCCDGFQREENSCTTGCPVMTYGPACSLTCTCLNGGSCDPVNGTCSCMPGWTGQHCHRTCPDDRYGEGCGNACQCLNGGSCNRLTGDCLCPVDFVGNMCEIGCLNSTTVPVDPRCTSTAYCDSCDRIERSCGPFLSYCVCTSGWQGRFCAHTCNDFKHGMFCQSDCGCMNAECNPTNGSCICRPGWMGERCDMECAVGLFGDGCREQCDCPGDDGCDHVDGRCSSCPAGWEGECCTSACEADHWGKSCSQNCDCADSEVCEPITGSCQGSGSSSSTPPPDDIRDPEGLSSGAIAWIVGSAILLVALVIIGGLVFILRRRRQPKLPSQQRPLQANGVAGRGSEADSAPANGTLRYQIDSSVHAVAPTPLPRSPATFPRPGNEAQEYETIPGDQDPANGPPSPYIEIYDELRAGQVDNPLYARTDADDYEIPTTPKGILDRDAGQVDGDG